MPRNKKTPPNASAAQLPDEHQDQNVNHEQADPSEAALPTSDAAASSDVSHDVSNRISPSDIMNKKIKIQCFRGANDKISIENWMKLYEKLADYMKWDDDAKIIMLSNFLEDDSLNWYVENCDKSWSDLKVSMNQRFGLPETDPLIECMSLKYDYKSGMKEYFEIKRRYGILAGLRENQVVSMMIEGLPFNMQQHFIAFKPKSYTEFFSIAKSAEEKLTSKPSLKPPKVEFSKFQRERNQKSRFERTNDKYYKKPSNPCRICENLGLKNRYHWAQLCRNRDKFKGAKEVNMVEVSGSNDSNSDEENPLSKIHLND